jgi:hypothetical protein
LSRRHGAGTTSRIGAREPRQSGSRRGGGRGRPLEQQFPAHWRADKIPGGYVVRDANGQALIYARDSEAEALQAKVLTKDEGRRIAVNIARLPEFARRDQSGEPIAASKPGRLLSNVR